MDDVFADGREAERLLADPTFQKAFARLEQKYTDAWKLAKSKDDREHLHACVRAVGDVRGELEAMKGNKAIADAENKRFGKPKR